MYPEQLSDPRQGVLTTGRMESTGQVVFQRGLQLPPLQPGTADVVVNGVDYRVRTICGAWSIGPSDVVFMPSPVTHITGAYWAVDIPWVCGTTSVLMDV